MTVRKLLLVSVAACVFAFAALFAAWLGCEIFHARTSDAEGIATHSAYRKALPEPRSATVLTQDGETYYVFRGPVRAPLAAVSGPPVYIFDPKGRLVDWTFDMGDDERFARRWDLFQGEEVSVAQCEALLAHAQARDRDASVSGSAEH